MKELIGDFWAISNNFAALIVTTNGVVKSNGELVMGAGIAKQFATRYPSLPSCLGTEVKIRGNLAAVMKLPDLEHFIISYPTKNHFKDKSQRQLLIRNAKEILDIVEYHGIQSVLSVRPGCGLGGLSWEEVKPILEKCGWDDRFTIISN